MDDQSLQPETPVTPEVTISRHKPHFPFILIGILLFILFGVGTLYLGQRSQKANNQIVPTIYISPTSMIQPSPTPDQIANWKTYKNTMYNYSLMYPPDLTVKELSGSLDMGENSSYRYITFNSPDNNYFLSFGLRKKGEDMRLTSRTGTGAGDIVTSQNTVVINNKTYPFQELVYNGKTKFIYANLQIEKYEIYTEFSPKSSIAENYESFDIKNLPEFNTATKILSTFTFLDQNPIKQSQISIVSGSVMIFSIDDKFMTIQLNASSFAGNIKEMEVWTDSQSNQQWQPYTTLIKLPVSEKVYARFRDDSGNISDIYTDSIHPPQGPPNSP